MKPFAFGYARPDNLSDARRLFHEARQARYLAGGQSLIGDLKHERVETDLLIDLQDIAELKKIAEDRGRLTIGALATHDAIATSPLALTHCPALAQIAGQLADPHVRHFGTIGGVVAQAEPMADYPAILLALGAMIRTTGRDIAVDDMFTGARTTALTAGEIVTHVLVPSGIAAVYEKQPGHALRYAIAGVCVARTEDGTRVAVTGAAPAPFRWTEAETVLSGTFRTEALDGLALPADGLIDDVHGGADYRAHLVAVLTRRAVRTLADET